MLQFSETRRHMKKLLITLIICLWAGNAFPGEYWFDSNLEENGNGSEGNPWNSMVVAENNIEPGDAHTFHLKGSDIKYAGGFGGYNLKRYLFYACTLIKDESNGKTVEFEPTKFIKFGHLSDGPTAGTKEFLVHPRFKMKGHRFYVDEENFKLILTRPIYLEEDANKGFLWDSDNHRVIITPALVRNKPVHAARLAELRALRDSIRGGN